MTNADPFGFKRSLNASIYSPVYVGLLKEEQDDYMTNTEVPSLVPSWHSVWAKLDSENQSK